MLRKNVAGQFVGLAAINATTGAAMTGTTGFAAYRCIDGGAQAAATGTVTDKGNGQYSFALSQADTNGNDISLLFTMTGMVPVEKTIVTTAADPTAATNFGITNLDATISSRSTYAGGDTAGTTTLLSRLTSGRATGLDNLDATVSSRMATFTYTVPPTVAAIRTEMDANSTKLANLDATVSSRSTYAGADTAGTTTLLARLTSGRATNLDNLDAAVSSRMATFTYTAPPTAVAIADAVLTRDASNVEGTMPEHCLGTVILATTEWEISGSNWLIKGTDGITIRFTKPITVVAGQITGVS